MTVNRIADTLSMLMGDMSESALARAVNLPKATIHRVLSGSTPDPRAGTLLPIAQYFNITIEQLMGISQLPSDSPLEIVDSVNAIDMPFISFDKLRSWSIGSYEPDKFYKITSFGNNPIDNNCFITQINSDEMAPLFSNKTFLIVRKKTIIRNDDIVIIFNPADDQVLIRKYVQLKGDDYLISSNQLYNIIEYNNEFQLIGIVIEGRIII